MSSHSSVSSREGGSGTEARIIEVNFGRKKSSSKTANSGAHSANGNSGKLTSYSIGAPSPSSMRTAPHLSSPQSVYSSYASPPEAMQLDEREGDGEEGVGEGDAADDGSQYHERRPSAYEQHSELMSDIQKDIFAFFSSSVLSTYMSVWAKAFLAVAVLSVVITMTFGGILLDEVYERTITVAVEDGSVCEGQWYTDPKSSTLWYNVALIFLANVFMLWYAFRGVALEKWGTAVCFIIAALTAVGRIVYTVAGGLLDAYKVSGARRDTCVGGLIAGAIIALISLGLLYKALREFGWRNYVKGATTPAQVYQMNRFQLMDLFLKLDVLLCVHTIVSIFFAVNSTAMIVVSGVVIAVTVVMLVLLTYFIKKQITWFVYGFVAICPAMPLLYIYLIVSQSILEESLCTHDTLLPCLAKGGNITVGPSNYSDTAFAAHTRTPPSGQEGPQWFILPSDCIPEDLNSTCANTTAAIIDTCCSDYGQCRYTQEFFRTDQVLLIMLAVAGVVVRVLTVVCSYKRMKEMDIPLIRELLERGDRNLRTFALIFVKDGGAGGGGGDHNRRRSASTVSGDGHHHGAIGDTQQLESVLMAEDA